MATGTFLMMGLWNFLKGPLDSSSEFYGLITTLIFMGITGALLVKDLDRPDRFLYVLLRPQWKSWLVKGAYIITIFGGLVTIKLIDNIYGFNWNWLWVLGSIFSVLGAIYTAFLFAQARARDLWQSKWVSATHMLVHAIISGSFVWIKVK
jgi:formate-dependent nitrite reductase membrane component NrfD